MRQNNKKKNINELSNLTILLNYTINLSTLFILLAFKNQSIMVDICSSPIDFNISNMRLSVFDIVLMLGLAFGSTSQHLSSKLTNKDGTCELVWMYGSNNSLNDKATCSGNGDCGGRSPSINTAIAAS